MLKIKKGDTVKVIAGKDKDKEGKVLSVKDGKVIVEGINMIKNTQNLLWPTSRVALSTKKLLLMHPT